MTQKERQFWQFWLDRWPRGRELSTAAIKAGISPFCRFREWLNREQTNMDLLADVLRIWEDEKFAPRLYVVRREYDRRCGRVDVQHGKPCEVCHATGWVIVPMVRRNGRRTPLPAPEAVDGLVYAAAVPCKCSTGLKANAARTMQYPRAVHDALWDMRRTPEQMAEIRRECHRLAGAPVRDLERDDTEFETALGQISERVLARLRGGAVHDLTAEWRDNARHAQEVADDEF